MEKVLSQDEIDSLINTLSSGEVTDDLIGDILPELEVKNYDFRRPNKLSKDHIHAIENLYENYSRISANVLSNHLRTNVELKVGSVEQVSYGEFIRSIPNPTILVVFTMEPLKGPLILEANSSLGFQFINYLCGGVEEDFTKSRNFSEIEMSLLDNIFSVIVESNATIWKDLIEIKPKLEKIETNPQLNQTLSYSDSIVLLTLKILIGSHKNIINLCIPYLALDPVMDKLNSIEKKLRGKTNSVEQFKTEIEEAIEDTSLKVDVLLGKTSITVDDFVDLQEGDVLALSNSVDQLLEVYVEDNLYYYAQPGLLNKKLSVQIVSDVGRKVT